MWAAVDLDVTEVHPLRRRVLRGGDPSANVSWAEDDRPSAFHLGVRDASGLVIAVASFSEERTKFRPGAKAWRLRGMAVDDHHQGQGIGQAILDEAVTRVAALGATVLWCHARDTAIAFYTRAGFVVVGDGFTTDETGLPHHTMLRDL
ncbi:MAG TPA: GNAT family N-acetyltransferase [Acidimicrobiales bacterium]|nr:GNAT family N-acetyltransferase [Acidimicrobiales bacterium]